jgi:hypothetical protein
MRKSDRGQERAAMRGCGGVVLRSKPRLQISPLSAVESPSRLRGLLSVTAARSPTPGRTCFTRCHFTAPALGRGQKQNATRPFMLSAGTNPQ